MSTLGKPPGQLSDDELLERIASMDVPLSERCRRALEGGAQGAER